jgi:hypothetical protein|mmetsp:Transcript_45894/g.71593  ORF Transcript_45894/g.71593 Transcript_45894/m.71593 type:complete len:242 (-) Transcript_45894:49-774(-)
MMSGSADPYYMAQEEVRSAIKKIQSRHEEWKKLLNGDTRSARFAELHAEISGELTQLGYDLQDITATIDMVEEHRGKFEIDDSEIKKRKDFVKASQRSVQDIKDNINSRQALGKIDADRRQANSNRDSERSQEVVRENEAFLSRQRQDQQQIMQHQDEALTALSDSVKRLGDTAQTINVELQDQQRMLEELEEDIDKETENLNFVMKKVGRLLKTSDHKQLCVIIALFLLMLGLLFLVINT